jgi:hypothetical protein
MTAALAEGAWDIVLCAHRMPELDAFATLAVLGRVSKSTAATARQGYVSGHPAPIAGLVEECPPWPT